MSEQIGQADAGEGNPDPRRWSDAEGLHIDVRGLEPPAPLVRILQLVESCDGATPVIVHHDRDPVLLYGELAERGWSAERIDGPPGEIVLKLEYLGSASSAARSPER